MIKSNLGIFFMCLMPFGCMIGNIFLLFNPFTVFFYCLYLLFILQSNIHQEGGRPSKIFRSLFLWNWAANYFDLKLIKTCNLDPNQKYIFGCHPHGLFSFSSVLNFATEANQFSLNFNNLPIRLCTIDLNFRIPLLREFLLAMGFVSASKDSISYLLKKNISVAIIIGGAQEALDARPRTNDLTIKSRKGFIKQAILNKAYLIPVFSFGENDLYKQIYPNPPKSYLRKCQEFLKNKFGYSLPLLMGTGIWTKYGLFPIKQKLITVVGEPIKIPPDCQLNDENIDKYHQMYLSNLLNLYQKYAADYDTDRKYGLRFVK